MSTWKKAFSLAKFELKVLNLYVFLATIVFLIILLLVSTSFPYYLENNYMGFDFIFIVFFSVAPYWLKGKPFQYEKVKGELWAPPAYIMFLQLPIPKEVLIKSRLLSYYLITIPVLVLSLILIYAVTPDIHSDMTIYAYIAFSIIWIAFSIYIGAIMPASDVGDYVNFKTTMLAIIQMVAFFAIIGLFFHFVLGYGVVYGTIIFAKSKPTLSILISLIASFLGLKFWLRYMSKKTEKLDYY